MAGVVASPPAELVFRVVGTEDVEAFRQSGYTHVDELGSLLAEVDHSYDDFESIYDFGCGCGRLIVPLRERAPNARLAGSDIDAEAIAWLREHLPDVDVRVNSWLPPLTFDTGSFDLVIAFSVFTHLPEDYQDAWLAELERVTRPGGIVLATVHGEAHWRQTWEVNFAEAPNRKQLLRPLERARRRRGFAYWREDGWEKLFPDFYHTSWHRPDYVRKHWARWFEVLAVREGAKPAEHDVVVLKRRVDSASRGRRRFLGF